MDWPRVKLLAMDVDGTLTDGRIYVGRDGEAMKAFDVHDGYAIAHMLPKMKIVPVVITGRNSHIVNRRCDELGIEHVYQGVTSKIEQLESVCRVERVSLSQVAYIGDDMNDLDCMQAVNRAGGLTACPANACGDVLDIATFVSTKDGGFGSVREFVEAISADSANWENRGNCG